LSELINLDTDWLLGHCADDPVRPHLPLAWRTQNGREVYGLQSTDGVVEAVICVAYCSEVPITEQQMEMTSSPEGEVAVFYTVWSYAKGAGREMVNTAAAHIKRTRSVKRYVTLSPITEMAEKFHLRNGATFARKGDSCQNFEYTL